ncbi:MAG TPA: hypothetical protein VNQ77_12845 [Frankiaceae bacterium]|nr:hypothetical protein [Frankiaceae bacterium]
MTARRTAAFLLAALVALAVASPAAAGPRDPYEIADAVLTECEVGECFGLFPRDGQICPRLQLLAPGAGPVVVNSQGDVFVAGEPFWDCPPYDLWPTADPAGDPWEDVFALLDTVDGMVGECEKGGFCGAPVDETICAAFAAFAPGAGPVAITPQGDVFLTGELFWDCPPYGLDP